jgi:hypothetical protein
MSVLVNRQCIRGGFEWSECEDNIFCNRFMTVRRCGEEFCKIFRVHRSYLLPQQFEKFRERRNMHPRCRGHCLLMRTLYRLTCLQAPSEVVKGTPRMPAQGASPSRLSHIYTHDFYFEVSK